MIRKRKDDVRSGKYAEVGIVVPVFAGKGKERVYRNINKQISQRLCVFRAVDEAD